MDTTITPALLTTQEAAQYLGATAKTLEVWRSTRRYAIPYIKIGAKVRYRKADLDAWIASRVVAA
ncbi:helix-turn-helix domain-containing protein [Paraburkholderia phytofirmans]|uniref:helix-turn-helix domain-containing protein n=1 Tax=Paraburkholderia sp. BL9I2N2 TaxID=1938809 RepID=UPI0010461F1C|nr:helix-turn-helix domain-containing protein [Paraburkholderia sp. BL9I2N2]TCK94136.1 excisionase family DNA binding protein [Paraburkholderia sp. BL9I2N2]